MKKVNSPTKLLWLDLEMTGLDPEADRIIEIAAIVTDFDFNELDRFEAIIHHDEKMLKRMNSFVRQMHESSGLINRVVESKQTEEKVEKDFAKFIKNNFKRQKATLAGNSIHMDRRFIISWWPEVEKLLHYRMLDISSFKLLMENKYHQKFTKKEAHLALDDILESIEELKFYLNNLHKI